MAVPFVGSAAGRAAPLARKLIFQLPVPAKHPLRFGPCRERRSGCAR
jgi:hypothetical protein